MTDIAAHGISVTVPPTWEGRVFRRPTANEPVAAAIAGEPAAAGETTNAVMHVSTVALPVDAADFGSNVVELLGSDDVLVVIFEYDPGSVTQALFSVRGVPRVLDPDEFSPSVLQRTVRGQAGIQKFFQEANRAFCLYVVLGSFSQRRQAVDSVNALLGTLEIGSPNPPPTTTVVVPSILERLGASEDLTTLSELLADGDARSLLEGTGPFTLLAPDNDAFASIDLVALRQDRQRLDRTLQHHILTGSHSVADLAQTTSVSPIVGDPLPVAVASDGHVAVGGAPIVRPDIDATNGYVHVIAGVLELPK